MISAEPPLTSTYATSQAADIVVSETIVRPTASAH